MADYLYKYYSKQDLVEIDGVIYEPVWRLVQLQYDSYDDFDWFSDRLTPPPGYSFVFSPPPALGHGEITVRNLQAAIDHGFFKPVRPVKNAK